MKQPRTHHTPIVPLNDRHGKLTGYACMHCYRTLTPSMQWSEPYIVNDVRSGPAKVRVNRADVERRSIMQTLRSDKPIRERLVNWMKGSS